MFSYIFETISFGLDVAIYHVLLGDLPPIKDGVKGAPNSHPVEVKITLRDSCPFALFVKKRI
jgi:hypothetical protein